MSDVDIEAPPTWSGQPEGLDQPREGDDLTVESTAADAPLDDVVALRYCLCVLHGDNGRMDPRLALQVRRMLEDQVEAERERVEIDIWLESPGGDAHSAYKLAALLRSYAATIRVVVPDFAKSAATLLALCGDEIYMGRGAELGPLDAQITNEQGGLVNDISALDVARSLEDLTRHAVNLAVTSGALIHQTTRVGRIATVNATLEFSAKFMEPLICQLDPREIHQSTTLLNVAQEYARRLLTAREQVHPRAMGGDPRSIAAALVEDYPTHGFVITIDEARAIGLPVHPIEQYDHETAVRALHREWEMSGTDVVYLQKLSDLSEGVDGE